MEHTRNDPESAPAANGLSSAGEALAVARKARGMTLEDVARRLRLTLAQVQALEADDHAYFAGAVFARGYTKSYGRLVGVDVEPLLPARVVSGAAPVAASAASPFAVRMREAKPSPTFETRRRSHLPAMIAASVLFLSGLAYYEFVINAPGGPASTASPERVSGNMNAGAGMASLPAAAGGTEKPPTFVDLSRSDSRPGTIFGAYSENLRLKTSSDPTSGAGARGLHFLFNNESWVEVRDAKGKIVYSRLNAPGSESIVQGEAPFSIIIGGASGVQLSYNGNRVDIASFMSDDVARLRLE